MPSPTQAAPLAPPKGRLDRAVTVLRQATQFTGEWLLQGFGVFLAFAFAYAAARFVAVGAFRVGFVAVEIAALAALAVATAIAIWATFGPARDRRLARLGRMEALGVSLAAVGFLLPLIQVVRLIAAPSAARRGAAPRARSRRGAARQARL